MRSLAYKPRRNRLIYACLSILSIYTGLLTRWHPAWFPNIVAVYGGDFVSGWMGIGMVGALFTRLSLRAMCAWVVLITCTDEVTQLYHAPWADNFRDTFIGGLFFGHGFVASDLVCYTLGALSGMGMEWLWYNRHFLFRRKKQLV